MSTINYRQIPNALRLRSAFKGNSVRGAKWGPRLAPSTGLLSTDEATRYRTTLDRAEAEGKAVYVVQSYATPIAWAVEGEGAYVVGQRFSHTTTRQQNLCRAYL